MNSKSIMETKKCLGCGIELQCEDDSKTGFIPKKKYNSGTYCQRCFKLMNYNEKVSNELVLEDDEILNKINDKDAYAFFLIDFLNISQESIDTFKKIKLKKTLIISKCDLIFKDIKLEKIKQNIIDIYNIEDNIIFLSSKNKYNINMIFNILNKNNNNVAYILGFTNAGKSTLINILKGSKSIATSSMVNTTLDFIEMKIDNYKIIDTPGFSLKHTFYKDEEYELMKKINPVYFVSPITYQTKKEQIFTVEDRLYLKGFNDDNSITFYISNLLKINKLYVDDNIKYREIELKDDSDIVINSIGFINVKKACTLCVNEDMLNVISVRDSILKK